MNKDAIISLAKVQGIESAEVIKDSIFTMLENTGDQSTYSDEKDLSSDFGCTQLTSLYSELAESPELSEKEVGDKIEKTAESMTDEYAEKIASLAGVSPTTDEFSRIRESISQVVYSVISEDLDNLGFVAFSTTSDLAQVLEEFDD